MNPPYVTIAIPTFNRVELLRQALASALAQDYPNIDVVVLDNAASDDVRQLVEATDHPRVRYVAQETNIGLTRNFNAAIDHSAGDYLVVLQDDDVLEPSFLKAAVDSLQQHPTAALAFTHTVGIDRDGRPGPSADDPFGGFDGLLDGRRYLQRIVGGENLVIHVSNAVLRRSSLREVGVFDAPHSTITINSNLYFRLAARFDLVRIAQPLAQIRSHDEADHLRRSTNTAPLAMLAERSDAAIHLLNSGFADDPINRAWLVERMLHLSMRRSETSATLIEDLTLPIEHRQPMAVSELIAITTSDDVIIFADNSEFADASGWAPIPQRRLLPFLERDGDYWGPPERSQEAIDELERMRREGATVFCFAWPTFWWYDYYFEFRNHLRQNYRCVLDNSRLIAFDLGS